MKKGALKAGILTFHRCINYGSYWQARCFAEEIARRGHSISILDHRSARVDIAEWKCALQPVLPTPVTDSDRRLYRKKIERFLRSFEELPLSPSFPLDHPSATENYDIVFIGSDEVFNLAHPWYGNSPLFYGEGIKSGRLIAYAASFGNYDASFELDKEYCDRLKRFDLISVRDENSRIIVKNATGTDPVMVLDPCLQFPVVSVKPEIFIATEPYIAVYGHNFSPHFIERVRNRAAKRNLPLVSIGYRNDWADEQWLTAGPHEFVSFMRQAEAVITNFFHGCIFAMVNSTPFVCESSQYRGIKVNSLLQYVGGEIHLINENSDNLLFNDLLSGPVSEGMIAKIERLRKESYEFLENALMPEIFDDLSKKILQSEEYN